VRAGQQVPVAHIARSTPSPTSCAASNTPTSCTWPERSIRSDIDTIDTELALADLDSVEKALNRAERAAKANDKDAIVKKEVLQKRLRDQLNDRQVGAQCRPVADDKASCATCSC
jgi:ribosome-binding ATPase YchF (GTP1/OBG family)